MIVWRDKHHLTATYAAALAPYLAQKSGLPFPGSTGPIAKVTNKKTVPYTVSAHLTCSALGRGKPVERDVRLEFKNGEIVYRHGAWKERGKRCDLWTGTVTDGSVTMTGHYAEGTGG